MLQNNILRKKEHLRNKLPNFPAATWIAFYRADEISYMDSMS